MKTMKFSSVFVSVLVLSIMFGGCAGPGTTAEANQASAELERQARAFVAAYSAHDVDKILSHLSDDVEMIKADGSSVRGKEAYRKDVELELKALPDLTMETENTFATEDQVCIQWNAKGTESGAAKGAEAFAGKAVSFRGVTILKVREGKVVRSCVYYDRAVILAQVGALQPPQPPRQ